MKPRFLADENVELDLVLGLQRRVDGVDIVRVQDVGLRTLEDPVILQWAADEGRVLISRDIRTVPTYAHERIAAGHSMPGVVILPSSVSLATAIDDLSLIATATKAQEWINRVVYLPLR